MSIPVLGALDRYCTGNYNDSVLYMIQQQLGGQFAFVSNTAGGDPTAYAISSNRMFHQEQPIAATSAKGIPISRSFVRGLAISRRAL